MVRENGGKKRRLWERKKVAGGIEHDLVIAYIIYTEIYDPDH